MSPVPATVPKAASLQRAGAIKAGAAPLPPLPSGLHAHLWADGGAPATLAGSHPYSLDLSIGLAQASGAADLRDLRLELPPGLLADPATAALCSAASFAAPRSSPFEASASGESCSARSQIGTVEAEGGTGEVRRFGLFNLAPTDGTAARFGAAPFGALLIFDVRFLEGEDGTVHLELASSQIPQGLALHGRLRRRGRLGARLRYEPAAGNRPPLCRSPSRQPRRHRADREGAPRARQPAPLGELPAPPLPPLPLREQEPLLLERLLSGAERFHRRIPDDSRRRPTPSPMAVGSESAPSAAAALAERFGAGPLGDPGPVPVAGRSGLRAGVDESRLLRGRGRFAACRGIYSCFATPRRRSRIRAASAL
jgi:hypothetical protein